MRRITNSPVLRRASIAAAVASLLWAGSGASGELVALVRGADAGAELVPQPGAAAEQPWSFELAQNAWSPLPTVHAARAAVTELRGRPWQPDAADGAPSDADLGLDLDGLRAFDVNFGAWWNQEVGAVVSARIIADTVEVAPQAMLVDACAAWRVARDEHTSIDLLAGARVAGASEQIDFGRGDVLGSFQSQSAAIVGFRTKTEVARGVVLGFSGDVAPSVDASGVAWSVGGGTHVELDGNWTLSLEAKWRTLDSALLEVLGANDASRSQAEGAFWIGLSKSF